VGLIKGCRSRNPAGKEKENWTLLGVNGVGLLHAKGNPEAEVNLSQWFLRSSIQRGVFGKRGKTSGAYRISRWSENNARSWGRARKV